MHPSIHPSIGSLNSLSPGTRSSRSGPAGAVLACCTRLRGLEFPRLLGLPWVAWVACDAGNFNCVNPRSKAWISWIFLENSHFLPLKIDVVGRWWDFLLKWSPFGRKHVNFLRGACLETIRHLEFRILEKMDIGVEAASWNMNLQEWWQENPGKKGLIFKPVEVWRKGRMMKKFSREKTKNPPKSRHSAYSIFQKNKNLLENKYVVLLCELLVMEEILHDLRCIKPWKTMGLNLSTGFRRLSSIENQKLSNSLSLFPPPPNDLAARSTVQTVPKARKSRSTKRVNAKWIKKSDILGRQKKRSSFPVKFINFMSFLYEKACQFCHFEWRPVPTQNHLLIHLWNDWKARL